MRGYARELTAARRETVVLSPHLDDAVLSCWHVLRGPGAVLVVNVFAGAPRAGSPLGHWDRLTGATDPAQRVRQRRAEDRDALAPTGRAASCLDLLDAQHRARALAPEEVIQRLLPLLGGALYAPAALGDHPDHTLLRDVAMTLATQGAEVHLYADLPHAIARGWPHWLGNGGAPPGDPWTVALAAAGATAPPRVHELDSSERAAKVSALRCYGTQLGALARLSTLPLTDVRTWRYEVTWPLAG